MPINPADITIHPFSFVNTTVNTIMTGHLSGQLFPQKAFRAIIVDSEQLIKNLCKQFQHGSRSNRETSIPVINDDCLMASIRNNVGYIIENTVQQNNMIVSDLCNMGKINLLLSTFSVRNYPITGIREIYLTRIPFENNNTPDLNKIAQIVNKVGGQSGMSCRIYAERKYVDLVHKALELTPEEYNVDPDEGGIITEIAKDLFKAILKK